MTTDLSSSQRGSSEGSCKPGSGRLWGRCYAAGLAGLAGVLLMGEPVAGAEADVVELEPVKVTGGRPAAGVGAEGWAEAAVVKGLGDGGRGTLGEALGGMVGLRSGRYGAGASRPVIRGLEGRRVTMRGEGLETGDLSASSPDHAVTMEPIFLREAIVRRSGGGAAIGGEVDSRLDFMSGSEDAPGEDVEIGLLGESGNRGRLMYLKAGERWDKGGIRLNALRRDFEDYRIPGYARTEAYDAQNRIRLPPAVRGQVGPNPYGTVPNSGGWTSVAGLGGGWYPSSGELSGGYQHYQSNYGVPVDGHAHGNPYATGNFSGPSPADGITVELKQDRWLLLSRMSPPNGHWEELSSRAAYTRHRQKEYEGSYLANAFRKDQLEALGWGRFAVGAWQGWLSLHGSDSRLRNRNVSWFAGRADEDYLSVRERKAGAALEFGRPLSPRFSLHGALQLDAHSASRSDRSRLSRRATPLQLRLEALFQPHAYWQAALLLSSYQRAPSAEEWFLEAPHGAIGVYQLPNPGLRLESAVGAEVRLQRTTPTQQWQLQAFFRQFENFIYLQNQGFEVGGLTAYRFIQEVSRFYGAEFRLGWRLPWPAAESWQLQISGDWMRGENTVRDEPLPRMPAPRLSAGLDARLQQWHGQISLIRSLRQDRVPKAIFGTLEYESPSPAYTWLRVSLSREFCVGQWLYSASLLLDNALNVEAREHTSIVKDVAPLPGRSLMLGISASR